MNCAAHKHTVECLPETVQLYYNPANNWGWLGALIMWLIIFIVLFWLVFYSLTPSFVISNETGQVDTSIVLLAAIGSGLILVLFIWIIKALLG